MVAPPPAFGPVAPPLAVAAPVVARRRPLAVLSLDAPEEIVEPTCRSHRHLARRPILDADAAISVLVAATDDGRKPCTVLACVDAARQPLTLFVFDGRPNLDDNLESALGAVLAAAASTDSPLAAMFLGSSRPGLEPGPTTDDERRWIRMAELCADAGVELLDWLLLNDGAACSVAEGILPGPGW